MALITKQVKSINKKLLLTIPNDNVSCIHQRRCLLIKHFRTKASKQFLDNEKELVSVISF